MLVFVQVARIILQSRTTLMPRVAEVHHKAAALAAVVTIMTLTTNSNEFA